MKKLGNGAARSRYELEHRSASSQQNVIGKLGRFEELG